MCVNVYIYSRKCFYCACVYVYILENVKIESFYRAHIKFESFHCARVCICVYILKNAKTNNNFTATNLQIMVVMNETVVSL